MNISREKNILKMKNNIIKNLLNLAVLVFCIALLTGCGGSEFTMAEIETDFGTMKVKLYNDTPKHKANFIKLANEGFYDGTLFHRVIQEFMIQGGDPDSKGAPPETMLGQGGPGYTIDAEIGRPHIKGALSAARLGDNQNPERKSSGSKFYIVHGKPLSIIDVKSQGGFKNITYPEETIQLYTEVGGSPFLDMEYTVFGEVVEGLDIIDKIAAVQTNRQTNRPIQDVSMKVRIIN